MKAINISLDPETRHALQLVFVSLAITIQLLIIIVLVSSFIPHRVDSFVQDLFPLYQKTVKPEREIRFYHLFVFIGIAVQALLLWIFRRKMGDADVLRKTAEFLVLVSFWLLVEGFAIFKIVLYGDPVWARSLLYFAIALSFLSQVFWPEVRRALVWVSKNYSAIAQIKAVRYGCTAMFLAFVAFAIYVVYPERVLGFIAVWGNWEQFRSGRQEGFPALNSLSDVSFLRWMMGALVIYFTAMFFLMRAWLKSSLIAAGAVVLAVKWQLFHAGVVPMFWQFPQNVQLTQFLDLGLMALLLVYVRTGVKPWLWAAVLGLCIEGGRYLWDAFSGTDTWPLYLPLRGRNFFEFIWQFVIPAIYAFTFLVHAFRRDRRREDVMIMAVCLFGMAVLAGHAKVSTISHYYTHALPLAMVFAFWVQRLCANIPSGRSMSVRFLWAFILVVGLLTNNLFMLYPNIFNTGPIKWNDVKTYYEQNQGARKP